ncbi:MAG: MBL fold metallo-hydrolase [Pseudomonadota bacterium]
MSLSRRTVLGGAAATAATFPVSVTLSRRALAAEATAQAPAFHRMAVGNITVTAIADGHLSLGAQVFPNASEEDFAAAMRAAFLPEDQPYAAPLNAYVVQTGDRTILIDAGASPQMAPSVGKLDENLAAAGIAPDTIDTILITHLHPDHIGGLMTDDGAVRFPNAELMVREAEVAFWTDPATRAAAPEGFRPMIDGTNAVVTAYADQTTRFADDGEKAPGVTSVSMPGHTPGHTGFRVDDGDASLLIWGDIIHNAPLQMGNPKIFIGFDIDGEQAVATRASVLDMVTADRTLVAGMHMPFPGAGHIAAAGEGFAFVPLPWQYR